MFAALVAGIIACVAVEIDGGTNLPIQSIDRHGAINRLRDTRKGKAIYFIFTADSMFEGGNYALDVMKEHGIKASFFMTGNFLRDSLNAQVIKRIIDEGHYLSGHGDRHILLADWDENRTTLATPDSTIADMQQNFKLLKDFGVDTMTTRYVVPPYEWFNHSHTDAYRRAGYLPVTPAPGVLTYRDYTTPEMDDYFSTDTIWANFIYKLENEDLNGRMIILHLGTQDARTDKFYYRLGEMIDSLQSKGYEIVKLPNH